MKTFIFTCMLCLIVFFVSVAFSDTRISAIPIEAGQHLPTPYDCIIYGGHKTDVMTLTFVGCPNHADIETYFPVSGNTSYFLFNGEILYFIFVDGTGKKNFNSNLNTYTYLYSSP